MTYTATIRFHLQLKCETAIAAFTFPLMEFDRIPTTGTFAVQRTRAMDKERI